MNDLLLLAAGAACIAIAFAGGFYLGCRVTASHLAKKLADAAEEAGADPLRFEKEVQKRLR